MKKEFTFEEYLNLPKFAARKAISKIRCSDHHLEIEKGRHRRVSRELRLCKLCNNGHIETETHFLLECDYYNDIKQKCEINFTIHNLFNDRNIGQLGTLILNMNEKRQNGLSNV